MNVTIGVAWVKIVADVEWEGSLAMEAGSGTVEIWFRSDITDDGQRVVASGHVCAVEVPDFQTNALAGGDTHGTVIPAEAWAGTAPTELLVELSGRTAGSTLQVNATPMFLGTSLDNPMGAWPDSASRLTAIDHDGDGYPGVTSYAASGPGYSNPRIDVFNADLRANRIFLGLRNVIGLNGMLTSCHGAQGTADLLIDQRAFGCLTPDNQQCNDGQANLLDTNMPQFNVRSATFTLERLDPSATCETIANALP